MTDLGSGLSAAQRHEEALSVREAELSIERRIGAPEGVILITQNNLANSYQLLGMLEKALITRRVVYSGSLKLYGEEHEHTLAPATNYAVSLMNLKRYEETKTLFRKTLPIVQRVLGENNELVFRIKKLYAEALYLDTGATLDDLREAMTTLEETARTARRVLGGAHPMTGAVESKMRDAQAALRAREDSV